MRTKSDTNKRKEVSKEDRQNAVNLMLEDLLSGQAVCGFIWNGLVIDADRSEQFRALQYAYPFDYLQSIFWLAKETNFQKIDVDVLNTLIDFDQYIANLMWGKLRNIELHLKNEMLLVSHVEKWGAIEFASRAPNDSMDSDLCKRKGGAANEEKTITSLPAIFMSWIENSEGRLREKRLSHYSKLEKMAKDLRMQGENEFSSSDFIWRMSFGQLMLLIGFIDDPSFEEPLQIKRKYTDDVPVIERLVKLKNIRNHIAHHNSSLTVNFESKTKWHYDPKSALEEINLYAGEVFAPITAEEILDLKDRLIEGWKTYKSDPDMYIGYFPPADPKIVEKVAQKIVEIFGI